MTEKKWLGLSRAEKTERRRLDIVKAAAACFIAKGFHQSSMRDIASVAGVSLGNLYNHFENKADLIKGLAALEEEQNQVLLEILAEKGPVMDIMGAFSETFIDLVRAPNNAALTAEIFAEAMRNPDIHEIFDRNSKSVANALSDLLQRGQTEGVLDKAMDTGITAALLMDLLEGAALRMAMQGNNVTDAERNEITRMVEKTLLA